ncbi:MAG: tetracycline resistance MFS efflux pump [Bacteroidia bacterium]
MRTTRRSNPFPTFLLTVFLDMLGLTIIIPILAPLLKESGGMLAADIGDAGRNQLYGLLLAVFSVCQFLSAPLLGSLSDRYGRKRVLFGSLFLTLGGYLLFAWGVHVETLWMLFAGRALSGLAAGNLSVIYSAVADLSKPEEKARRFGLLGVAFGVGFIIGPAIGGLLGNSEVVSWFSYATPFLFSAALVALNLVLVYFNFPETLAVANTQVHISPAAGFHNLQKAFTNPALRTVFLTVFFFTFGFSFFTQFFQIYLIDRFAFDEGDIGLLFSYIGIMIALTQGGLVRYTSRRFTPVQVLSVSLGLLVVAYLCQLLPDSPGGLYLVVPLIAISQGLSNPNLSALISNTAPPHLQGETLGMQQSVQSLAQMLPPLIGGYAVTMALALPMWLAAGSTLVCWIIFMTYFLLSRSRGAVS